MQLNDPRVQTEGTDRRMPTGRRETNSWEICSPHRVTLLAVEVRNDIGTSHTTSRGKREKNYQARGTDPDGDATGAVHCPCEITSLASENRRFTFGIDDRYGAGLTTVRTAIPSPFPKSI